MCPLWPLHIILMYLLMLYPVWVLCQNAPRFQASYRPDNIEVHMDQYEIADFNVTGLPKLYVATSWGMRPSRLATEYFSERRTHSDKHSWANIEIGKYFWGLSCEAS
ncbi:hypothetical protein EVAR_20312_1 [Eumeta japonica]|uniref:Uncharacterized protein n=1 Tax=Eumeta variegata TaxID=151549 RepID=A0A4C1VM20_EUMVA|nr:hypothetical protein EVAR_20312_1 [Eumeta japonica]